MKQTSLDLHSHEFGKWHNSHKDWQKTGKMFWRRKCEICDQQQVKSFHDATKVYNLRPPDAAPKPPTQIDGGQAGNSQDVAVWDLPF